MLRLARPAAVLTDPDRAGELPGVPALVVDGAGGDGAGGDGAGGDGAGGAAGAREPVPAAPAGPGPGRVRGFTSGSTGGAEGVQVPHRGVVRLGAPPATFARRGRRFLRLAPLAFDASTLELFGAAAGRRHRRGYPTAGLPAGLAAFLPRAR